MKRRRNTDETKSSVEKGQGRQLSIFESMDVTRRQPDLKRRKHIEKEIDLKLIAQVKHLPREKKFVLILEDGTAECQYAKEEEKLEIWHTTVPTKLQGRGLAAVVVAAAFNYAKKCGLTVDPSCSYVRDTFLANYPDFQIQASARPPKLSENTETDPLPSLDSARSGRLRGRDERDPLPAPRVLTVVKASAQTSADGTDVAVDIFDDLAPTTGRISREKAIANVKPKEKGKEKGKSDISCAPTKPAQSGSESAKEARARPHSPSPAPRVPAARLLEKGKGGEKEAVIERGKFPVKETESVDRVSPLDVPAGHVPLPHHPLFAKRWLKIRALLSAHVASAQQLIDAIRAINPSRSGGAVKL